MEPYIFCDLLADLDAEFRRNYISDTERLTNNEPINERETFQVEDIDQIDHVELRRKNWLWIWKLKT